MQFVCSPIPKHCAPFSDTGHVHNMFAIDCNKSSVNFTGSNVFRLQKPNHASHLNSRRDLISARSLSQPFTPTTWKSSLHQLHELTIYTLLNTPNGWSGTMKQLRGLYVQTFFTFRTTLVLVKYCFAVCEWKCLITNEMKMCWVIAWYRNSSVKCSWLYVWAWSKALPQNNLPLLLWLLSSICNWK